MRNVILIGFMGAGKTTVGKALAKECKLSFVDTDERIEEEQNRSISDIFAKEGESFFRNLETQQLRKLRKEEEGVISVGGGLPVQEANWDLLKQLGTTIYLKASKETLVERLQGDSKRPLLQGGELEMKISSLMNQREAIYEKVADRIIVTDGKQLKDIIEEIKKEI